jgi:hypothetical protein
MKSYKPPTQAEVEAVAKLIVSPHHAEYFLDRLENPHWIKPLSELGLFKKPLGITEENGQFLAYRWPESQYLARMASAAPQEVANIFKKLTTDNWRILHDVVTAAKAMPAEFAAALVPVISKSHKLDVRFYGLNDIAELIAKLAKDGQPDAAVELMRKTMKLNWKDRHHQDGHWYIDGLSTHVIPALAIIRTSDLIKHLTSELKAAIKSDRHRPRQNSDDDYSYVWRPAIEDDEQNLGYDSRDDLVGCLRDAYEQAIRGDALELESALQLLEKESLLIFKRLRLHLIRVFAERAEELVRDTIMDRILFDDYHVRHEYAVMVRDHFNRLHSTQKETWIAWVDQGPNESYRTQEDAELVRKRADYWKFEKLFLIRGHLQPPKSDFVEQMLKDHGEPELALYPSYSRSGFIVDQSPFPIEEMQSRSFENVIQMVANWRPLANATRYETPSLEGLRRIFNQYVGTDPVTFAKKATLMKGMPAPFVRAFLEAMLQPIKEKKQIEVEPLLELSEWIVAQSLYEKSWPTEEDERFYDHDWQWTWNSLADLWEVLCGNAPIELRTRVWGVIERLLGGGSLSGHDIKSDGNDFRSSDFITHAINSAQGKAMEALIAYTRWVAKTLEVERDGHTVFEGGFAKLPEVQKALDDKLKPENSSFASHAMYGWYFNLLYWIDNQWVASNVATIFDLKHFEIDPKTAYGWAAWNCFLVARNPRVEYYALLKDQYSYGVDQVVSAKFEEGTNRFKPFGRLGEHLMILYGLGHIPLEGDDNIIHRFVDRSPIELRSATIEFIGQAVGATDDLEAEVIERYKTLWAWYWNKLGQNDAKGEQDSSVFGTWFVSGKFDNQWSLERLDEFTDLVPKAGPEYHIVKRLAEIASTDIQRSTKILGKLLDGDKEGWRIYHWRDDAMTILKLALDADGDTETLAEGIIDKLGRRRFTEFGKLLKLPGR